MPHFTCLTENRDCIYLMQFEAETPDRALRLAITALPYDDLAGPFEEELNWLHEVAAGEVPVTMQPVVHCRSTWLWLEGARYYPPYTTYVIKTDVSA